MKKTLPAEQVGLRDLRIQLMGGFAFFINGESFTEKFEHLHRARRLIILLSLVPGNKLHRDQIIEKLWPDSNLSTGSNNFHQTLYTARNTLGGAGKILLTIKDGMLSLVEYAPCALHLDVDEFEMAAAKARVKQDIPSHIEALSLYPGDLLPEEPYEEWITQRRDALQRTYQELLLELACLYESSADYPKGIQILQALLAIDPSCEDAHKLLIRLYALNNQRQKAIRQYHVLKESLEYELEIGPSDETRDLFEAIQSGKFPARETTTQHFPDSRSDIAKQVPNNLPLQLTTFIGRDQEIAEVLQLLENHRMVTLIGAGGTGKTRLAVKVAERMLESFPNGVWFADLAPLTDPNGVSHRLMNILGILEFCRQDDIQQLVTFLKPTPILLVIDNCEHLLDACAGLVHTLLAACPHLLVLATSRELLAIPGENVYRVPSMAVPEWQEPLSMEMLSTYDALHLFVERARAIDLTFKVDQNNLPVIANICRRLDGIPLAIEMAAARVNVLSVGQIHERLNDRFSLLTAGNHPAIPRHRTLAICIDWSYSLLSDTERSLLECMAVFQGGCTLKAAETVCAFDGLSEAVILEGLMGLANKSIISVSFSAAAEARYMMPESLHQYAQQKLGARAMAVRDRHLNYYMEMAEKLGPMLKTPQISEASILLDADFDNLRAAMSWSIEKNNQDGYCQELRIFNALEIYWHLRGRISEALKWGTIGLKNLKAINTRSMEVRALSCFFVGLFTFNIATSRLVWEELFQESADLFRKTGNRNLLARAMSYLLAFRCADTASKHDGSSEDPNMLSQVVEECLTLVNKPADSMTYEDQRNKVDVYTGLSVAHLDSKWRLETGRQLIEEADLLAQKLDLQKEQIWSAIILGEYEMWIEDNYAKANRHLLRALHLAKEIHDVWDMYFALSYLASSCYFLSDYLQMKCLFEENRQVLLQITGRWENSTQAWFAFHLGLAHLHLQDYSTAEELFLESISCLYKDGSSSSQYSLVCNFLGLAGIAAHTGNLARAGRLLGFFASRIETQYLSPRKEDFVEFQRSLEYVRDRVLPNELAVWMDEGRSMSMTQVMDETDTGKLRT